MTNLIRENAFERKKNMLCKLILYFFHYMNSIFINVFKEKSNAENFFLL